MPEYSHWKFMEILTQQVNHMDNKRGHTEGVAVIIKCTNQVMK